MNTYGMRGSPPGWKFRIKRAPARTARPADSLHSPNTLPRSDSDEHDPTLYPYRNLSENCVKGRRAEMGYHSGDDRNCRALQWFWFDCRVVTRNSVYSWVHWDKCDERELDARLVAKVLVVKETKSKILFAHSVAAAGAREDGLAEQHWLMMYLGSPARDSLLRTKVNPPMCGCCAML